MMPRHLALLLPLVNAAGAAGATGGNFVDGQCTNVHTTSSDLFPDKCEYGTQFTQVVAADYSLLWSVEYHDSYKVVRNERTGAVHVLHQCGVVAPSKDEVPADAKDAPLVEVPLTSVAAASTAYLAFIEMLGERRSLKSYQSSFYEVSSPCLRRMYRDGLITEKDLDAEPPSDPDLRALGVGATFASSSGMDDYNAVELTDAQEEMPHAVLKAAEYVEYVGLYFNREKEAAQAIARIVANWLCTKEAVRALAKPSVKVLWAHYWAFATCSNGGNGGWSVAAEGTWYSEIVETAGGELIVPGSAADCESDGVPYLSTAQLLEVGGDADVFISSRPFPEAVDVSSLPAYQDGRVFDNQGPNGANDWFERRVVEPDALLQDMAVAFYPDAAELEGLSRKWLRDVVADEPVGGVLDEDLDAACPDIDAPYEFSSTNMCAWLVTEPASENPSDSSNNNSPETASGGVIAAFVVASALVLLAVGGLSYYTNRPYKLVPPANAPDDPVAPNTVAA